MSSTIATKPAGRRSRRERSPKLANKDIQRRLEQIELATVSLLRALQMDIDGDVGVASASVLKKARASLR